MLPQCPSGQKSLKNHQSLRFEWAFMPHRTPRKSLVLIGRVLAANEDTLKSLRMVLNEIQLVLLSSRCFSAFKKKKLFLRKLRFREKPSVWFGFSKSLKSVFFFFFLLRSFYDIQLKLFSNLLQSKIFLSFFSGALVRDSKSILCGYGCVWVFQWACECVFCMCVWVH